ncbi:riboflavin synthase [Deminuibacter soli]|uniref:Riboflavin synthase n=1 Tax=Deminuibacter soli TaxID=2291815 RepID=A0A3E1NL81_9BACT|nr:riboflavin synthase [Deminuibacter soli]RFM28686.1 riboflavin synthase [Deminuibacter soli]
MFTGIVETTGIITGITTSGTNKSFWIQSSVSPELKIDQSISHDGVCLTVEALANDAHQVTAIAETIQKTNLGQWKTGDTVNLERCMIMNGRLDGHIVQGHVDTTATCVNKTDLNGSWEYTFEFPDQFAHLVIEKGSISLNGTSLTIFNVTRNRFTVAIIPYTYHHTSIRQVTAGSVVNIEFDMVGKYIYRMQQLKA